MHSSALDRSIREMLGKSTRLRALSPSAMTSARHEIEKISQTDYCRPLRETFVGAEIRELIREARRFVWPNLNEEPLKIASPREFIERYGDLGVQVKFAKPSARELEGVLGFYVRKTPRLKRPLIWVNVAKHRAVMSAAFAHEMGHHLSTRIFGQAVNEVHFLYTRYADHLWQAEEITADLFVSLGCLPRPVIGELLHQPQSTTAGINHRTNPVDYFRDQYQIRFDGSVNFADAVQCLAGMLHYTKLRHAILTEFDI